MQQLTIQFDGYAPIGESRDVSATTERRRPDFYEAIQHFSAGLQKSVTKPSGKILEGVSLLGQAAAVVSVGFGLCFMAAIIGG